MPTYEYACRDCGEHLEVVQSFKDDPLTVCPACQGRLRKVFSAAGIVFKGSGWHIKDYAPSSKRTEGAKEKTDTSSSSDTSSSDTSSSDTSSGDQSGSASSGTEKKTA